MIGVQIWSSSGQELLYFYSLSDALPTTVLDESTQYMRGIAGRGKDLCVGKFD